MPDKCLDCPAPSADMDGFIVSGPGGAPRSEGSGVSSPEGPFVREAPQTGHFILKGKVSSSSPLPEVPEPGWAYEAAEAGTYGGVHATPGDLVWCAGVNPVRWRIAQSDFDGAVRSVSVRQVLSSGTKIATVTVDGQATDLYCETGGGIQTLSGEFGCETREISPAVNEPAALYATQIIYLDQAGYEALEGGSKPSSSHWEYAGSGSSSILVHDSSSFMTLPVSSESSVQVPYAIALSTGTDENASGYNLKPLLLLDWPYGGAVKISDLLAAGETGVKLAFLGSDFEPYGDGTLDVYVSFSSLAANPTNSLPPYVVSYSARKDAVTEDVLTAKIDGKDGSGAAVSSVDVSPLLNYIGGRIEEVPAGDSEMLPLVDYENPGTEPPFYFINPGRFVFFASGSQIYPSGGEVSGGAQIISFSASSPEPDSFMPMAYYGDSSGSLDFLYAKIDSSTGMPARFPLETALAGPIVLDEFSPTNPPSPTGSTVSLVTERVEGDVPAYRFTLYSGSGEMKKVLRLYPSCDNAIDLSGLDFSQSAKVDCFVADVIVCVSTDVVDIESLYEYSYDSNNVYSRLNAYKTLAYEYNYVPLEFNIFADTATVKTLFATFEVYLPNAHNPIVLGFVIDVSSISPQSSINLNNVPLYEFDYAGDEYKLSSNFSLTDVNIFATVISLTSCTCFHFRATVNKISDIDTSIPVEYAVAVLSSGTTDSYSPYDRFPTQAHITRAIENDNKIYELSSVPNSYTTTTTTFRIDPTRNTKSYIVLDRNAVFSFSLSSPIVQLIPNLLYVVDLYIDNSGSYTMTWPSSVKWSGGATPAFSTTGMNIVRLSSLDAGTTWYGEIRFAE